MASYKDITGHLPTFVKKKLHNRIFQVTLGDATSDCFDQEAGVPQGSVLSTILFRVKINEINKK